MPALVYRGFILIFVGLMVYFGSNPVEAAPKFNQASVTIDRAAPNSAISSTICIQPTGTATEHTFQIDFPVSFVIDEEESNWSITSANLPAGTLAWPGTGSQPADITDNSITISSDDLTSTNRYCFRLSSNTSSLGNTEGTLDGYLTTRTSGNSEINSSSYAVTVGSDQVTISAVVGADPSDFSSIISFGPLEDSFSEKTELEFLITYNSRLPYNASQFKVIAEWDRGALQGVANTYYDVYEYIPGSATHAYNAAPPVIDTLNRRITWTIPSFPQGAEDQTVRFKLRLKEVYQGSQKITLTTRSFAQISDSTSSPTHVELYYLYSEHFPGYKPPPGPTATNTPIPSLTPTPTPIPVPALQSIEMAEVTDKSASIRTRTNMPSRITVRYGTSPEKLNKVITSQDFRQAHDILLPDLQTDTHYFFSISAVNRLKKNSVSEIFTFKTSERYQEPSIDSSSVLITASSNVLLSPLAFTSQKSLPVIVLPQNAQYEIGFSMRDQLIAKNIQLITKNDNVLGLVSFANAEPNSFISDMLETQPGFYFGRLKSNDEPGLYTQILRISDFYGNVTETALAKIRVVSPFRVLDTENSPIENARIMLSRYNSSLKIFEEVSPSMLAVSNPSYSDIQGKVHYVLPHGKYQAHISAYGHKEKNIEFVIEPGEQEAYPTILLTKTPFSFIETMKYYVQSFWDTTLSHAIAYTESVRSSSRFFDVFSLIVLMNTVFITFLAFRVRTQLPLSHTLHQIVSLVRKNHNELFLRGRIQNSEGRLLSRAHIFLIDDETGHVAGQTTSNVQGVFLFKVPVKKPYRYLVLKKGFDPTWIESEHIDSHMQSIELTEQKNFLWTFTDGVIEAAEKIFSSAFVIFLVISFVLEIIFTFTFGIYKVLPFMILTLLNMAIWISFMRKYKI